MTTTLSNSANSPEAIIREAIALDGVAVAAKNAAGQMAARGIMLRHTTMIDQGVTLPFLAALSNRVKPNAARTEYLAALMETYAPASMKNTDGTGDASSVNNEKRNTIRQTLARGLQLAVDLDANGVTASDWRDATQINRHKAGHFVVPARMLKKEGETAAEGALLYDDNAKIALNGQAFKLWHGDDVKPGTATVARVLDVAKAKDGIPTQENKGPDVKATEPESDAPPLESTLEAANKRLNEFGLELALFQAAKFLNHVSEIVGERGLPMPAWTELDETFRHAIEAVELFAAECRAAKPAE